jgi:hypothetical protein
MSKSFTYTFNIFTFFMIIPNIHSTDILRDFKRFLFLRKSKQEYGNFITKLRITKFKIIVKSRWVIFLF